MNYQCEQWRACEIPLTSAAAYQNPFMDVDVTAVFTGPGGREIKLLGFWDGGDSWKVRFAPTEVGEWTYVISSTNGADAGLAGSGTVVCTPYTGDLAIYKHGFLRVGPRGTHLAHADGTPFFWLGDTHWTFVTEERLDESNCPEYESQFKGTVDLRAEQGFNVYQCNFRDGKDYNIFGRYLEYLLETEQGYLPNIEFLKTNPDPKMAYLADKGFVIAAGYSWGTAILAEGKLERYKLLAKYLVARYGAYPMVWTLAGELPGYTAATRQALGDLWREVALETERYDGYGHLQSAHYATDRPLPDLYQGEGWFDLAMCQGGHGDYRIDASVYGEYTKRFPATPLVESEALYDGIPSHEANGKRIITPIVLRRAAYLAVQNGACGYTYGAGGVWELQWEAVEPDSMWGVNWGSLAWYDGLKLPGARSMTILRAFYESVGFHRLRPLEGCTSFPSHSSDFEILLLNSPCFSADPEMGTVVGYYAESCRAPVTIRTLPQRSYTARWFNPDNGEYTVIDEDIRPENGNWTAPRKPPHGDWLLLLQAI